MTASWLDDDYGLDEQLAEDLDDNIYGDDPDYGEATRDHRRTSRPSPQRQATARQVAAQQLARRRQQATVRDSDRRPVRVADQVRRTQAAVQEVDLRGRVVRDEVGSALRTQSDRTTATERALAAKIVEERLRAVFGTHPLLNNALAETVLPLSPLLFLRPSRGPLWQDVRLLVPAAVAGITLGKKLLSDDDKTEVADIRIDVTSARKAGRTVIVKARALDAQNRIIRNVDPTVTTTANMTEDPKVKGRHTLVKANEEAIITAKAGDVVVEESIFIE
ncbi:hypothetical protein OG418_00370 [Streptomyces phaeochromogenes]|uniref:hypothetical protein n=1 Tax=Streptomyces phaeochromogenes TaxID=1923 RepID=UPI00324A9B20